VACHCDPRQEFSRIIPRDVRAVDFRPPEHGTATLGYVPCGVEIRFALQANQADSLLSCFAECI
jgi:hypothetical protein